MCFLMHISVNWFFFGSVSIVIFHSTEFNPKKRYESIVGVDRDHTLHRRGEDAIEYFGAAARVNMVMQRCVID